MTHKQMVQENENEKLCNCEGELSYKGTSFHSDVNWKVYHCNLCNHRVYTVRPGHWWNHTGHKSPQE